MRPWGTVIALAQMSGTPSSTSTEVVRMLASRSVPMATTARPNSPAPSWRRTSRSVVSASRTWVRSSAWSCTILGSASTPSTSWPSSISVSARALPNRPSPITSTPSSGTVLGRRPRIDVAFTYSAAPEGPPHARRAYVAGVLANDRSLLRVAVAGLAVAQGERGGQCNRARPAEEHEQDQDVLGGQGKLGGDPGGQPDRPEGREGLEQGARQREPALGGDGHGGRDHRPQPDEGHGQGLALGGLGDA